MDRLVQSVRQHVQFRRHFRHAPRPIEQLLRLFQHWSFQHRRRTVARLGRVEPLGAVVPIHLHIPLHRDHRHAKRLDDLFGFHRPAGNHLAGEHAETPYVLLLVLEPRQEKSAVQAAAYFSLTPTAARSASTARDHSVFTARQKARGEIRRSDPLGPPAMAGVLPYLASRQLSPVPMSTTGGTVNWHTPSISRFTIPATVSNSSGGHSKTNSSCTWSSNAVSCPPAASAASTIECHTPMQRWQAHSFRPAKAA